jgi:hypothetical protein
MMVVLQAFRPMIGSRHAAGMLTFIFLGWAAACVAIGVVFLRRAPAVTVALIGSVAGGVFGFLIGNADGPAEVPAYTAVGASAGLIANGLLGLIVASGRAPARRLWRAAVAVVMAAPFAAGTLTILLQTACPLYVSGKRSGFCNYQGADLLGGWVSGVIVAFLFDALFVAGLLLASARQARVRSSES